MKNYKKQEFAATYTNISKYIEQDGSEYMLPSVIGKNRTTEFVTVIPNVKNSLIVPMVDSTINFVDASTCSDFNDAGTTAITGVTVSVSYIKHEEAICLSEMEQYFYGKYMAQGSDQTEIPFEQFFMDEKYGKIAKKLDTIFWQGGNGVQGVLTGASASGATILATQSFALSTAVNNGIILTLDNMVDALSSDYRDEDGLTIFVSIANFDKYVRSLRNLNLFHFDPSDIAAGVITMFGKSNVKIVSTVGMPDTQVYLHKASFILWGTDLNPEDEPIKGQYDFVKDKYLVRYKVKIGSAIAFANKSVLARA